MKIQALNLVRQHYLNNQRHVSVRLLDTNMQQTCRATAANTQTPRCALRSAQANNTSALWLNIDIIRAQSCNNTFRHTAPCA
jgi:hypothetical protein